MTERKMEMRRHEPPRNSGSAVPSITSTLPWAGAAMTLESEGTFGLGSRKNQRQYRAKNIHSEQSKTKLATLVSKAPTKTAATPGTTSQSSATSLPKLHVR